MRWLQSGAFAALLLAALLVPPVAAAGITITAEAQDYFFLLGEEAKFPLRVANTYPSEVDGSLQIATSQQLQKLGITMTSAKNRVFSRTLPAGNSLLNVSAGTSTEPTTILVEVAYQYTDTVPVVVSLPAITVHFVENLPQGGGTSSPVTSTSAAGSAGGVGTSSVQVVQQSVSVQQQLGWDGTAQENLQNGQMAADTAALKEQLAREAAARQQAEEEFRENLNADPLVKAVNASLAAEGFYREAVETDPVSGDSGTFTMSYRNAAGEGVSIGGGMQNGTVPSVTEQSSAAINVTPALSANSTYQSFSSVLTGEGFRRNMTVANVTLNGSSVSISYRNEAGGTAVLNATAEQGNVTAISLARDEPEADYLPAVLILAAVAVAAVLAWLLYRRLRSRPPAAVPAAVIPEPVPVPIDHRREALRLLSAAETAFAEGRQTEAYGLAGQAARLFLSHEYGDRREKTVEEIAPVVARACPDPVSVMALLERCSDVEFAKGAPDPAGFADIVRRVRAIVTGT